MINYKSITATATQEQQKSELLSLLLLCKVCPKLVEACQLSCQCVRDWISVETRQRDMTLLQIIS